ncbi:NPCBM/NEW2 domain-containing protein [Roseimicrobium gellanilyticum]|uniref:NPCBM/NEW2 domain-containing protein n=1 Tax=Roseimicrobium gellanilyticum TaxID=748857 RepID=A0A366H3K4_9BACT|nr:NPCBM/NEW2 domain-containing protein [Roseimicrobium gellanilyticum]RBP35878.1 NPCBM/NEW2 domain-containing protein [Roseimicrobium gellanilyticum]
MQARSHFLLRRLSVILAAALPLITAHARDPKADIAEQVPPAVATLKAYHGDLPGELERKLHVIYWTPADREPQPLWRERLSRVMETTADFYEKEMKRMGFPVRRIPLDHDADGLLKIHLVKGEQPYAHYDVKSGSEIRRECLPTLRKAGVIKDLSGDSETIVIFCNMSVWDAEKRTMRQNSPYYAGGSARSGTAWQVDSPLLDPALLAVKDQRLKDGQYGDISVGRYNSIFVGGVIHELGHALGLPHNKERPDEAALFGTALMGSGNRTYGEDLRGEGKGSFLTLAHAMRLASHPLFTGSSKGLDEKLKSEVGDLSITTTGKTITVTGKLEATPPAYALVGYSDYNQASISTIPAKDGTFTVTFDALEPAKTGELRFITCHANGLTVERRGFHYTVSADGTPDVSTVEAKLLLDGVVAKKQWANMTPDQILATLPPESQSAGAKLARKVAKRFLLPGPKATQSPADITVDVKSVSLCDTLPKSQKVGWGSPAVDRLAEEPFYPASSSSIFERGIYAHAPAQHVYDLGGTWSKFKGTCGLAREHDGSVVFVIKGDGKELWRSKTIKEDVVTFDLTVTGIRQLELVVENAGDDDRSDWGLWLDPELTR